MNRHFRTIVGGRSTAYQGLKNFPRGIEILLKKAKVDRQFRKMLLQDPINAARSIELNLQDNETRILANIPKSVLNTMI